MLTTKVYPSIKNTEDLNAIKFNKLMEILPTEYRFNISSHKISDYQSAIEQAQIVQNHKISNEVLLPMNISSTPSQIENLRNEIHQLKETLNKFYHDNSNRQVF